MKININTNKVINIYNQNSKNAQIDVKKKQNGDKIEISKAGKEISKYIKLAESTEVKNNRVDEIKKLMEQNNYKIDSGKLAESILSHIKERDI